MSSRQDKSFAHLIPSDDWELNVLLLQIAKNLTASDFEHLKFLCTGFGGVPKRVLEHLTTPEMLFTHLREKKMISRDNLLLLQAFMSHLDREDLRKLAANYARQIGDTLYYHTPDQEPSDGFKHVQFHVEGNLDSFQRSELEALRAKMSRLLFVPEQYIILHGVEPGGSLNLTFMIQENEATALKELFMKYKDSFARLGVDGISLDNTEYIDPVLNLKRRSSVPDTAVTQEQLSILYRRNLNLESQVEESEVRSLESQADAALARQEAQEWREKENYFRCLLARVLEEHEGEIPKKSTRRRGSVQLCVSEERKLEMQTIETPLQVDGLKLMFSNENENNRQLSRKRMLRRGSVF